MTDRVVIGRSNEATARRGVTPAIVPAHPLRLPPRQTGELRPLIGEQP
jgi:hypothetical protein